MYEYWKYPRDVCAPPCPCTNFCMLLAIPQPAKDTKPLIQAIARFSERLNFRVGALSEPGQPSCRACVHHPCCANEQGPHFLPEIPAQHKKAADQHQVAR